MATRERSADRGNRLARRALLALGDEIREARLDAGLSQALVGSAASVSHATVGRIERGQQAGASLALLSRICAAVGLDLSLRAYPGADPIRDVAQVRLLARLRDRAGPGLAWRTEVPLPIPGDPRAWDATISARGVAMAVEAETRLRDVQAVDRRIARKRRDGQLDLVILLVADTAANRRALAAAREALRASFPLDGRVVLPALVAGRLPAESGIVLL
ncbi:MAG: helix-turn-helix transcriptional regulator [Candidatus Limnocylindrales bacterium]